MEDDSINYNKSLEGLMEAVAEKNLNQIRQYAQKTLGFARVLKLPHLEVTALCMTATGFLAVEQLGTALKIYDEATKIAKEAVSKEEDKDLYKQLVVQIILYRGSALLTQKTPQYHEVTEVYQQAADILQRIIDDKGNPQNVDWLNGGILYLYHFEALRILGYCQEQLGRQQAALKHYIKAVSTAEKMAADIRKTTPLNIVGKALLNLCKKLGMKKEYFIVIDKMNGLLGEGWEKEAPKTK